MLAIAEALHLGARELQELATETKNITGGGTFLTKWHYNSADLVTKLDYPGGAGGESGEDVTSSYNPSMQLTGVSAGTDNYMSAGLYDSAGRLTSRALGTGLTQGYSYYQWDAQVGGSGNTGRPDSGSPGPLVSPS